MVISHSLKKKTTVNNDPHPTKGATGRGGGRNLKQHNVELPPEHMPEGGFRDRVMPTAPEPKYDKRKMAQADHYTSAVETRPLPKTPNRDSMSHSSRGGFTNHGFSSCLIDEMYIEILDNRKVEISNEFGYAYVSHIT